LGHEIEAKPYRLDSTQKVKQRQGGNAATLKVGLSYVSHQPVRISRRRKDKQTLCNTSQLKRLMIVKVKIPRPTPKRWCSTGCSRQRCAQRSSVFRSIENGKIQKPAVFHRLKKDEQPKPSVFTRIKIGETSSSAPLSQKRDVVFSHLGKTNKVQSSISSRMKCVSTLDVKVNDSLKVKRRVLILTGLGAKANLKERTKEEEQTSSNRDTNQEVNALP